MQESIQDKLNTAIGLHQAGQAGEAAALYEQILSADAMQHQAAHLLAMITYQQGDRNNALALWKLAASGLPSEPMYRNNCGEMLRQLGQLEEAEVQYLMAVAMRPDFAEAHNNLGLSYLDRKQYAEAAQVFQTAITLKPEFSQAHNNLGSALKSLGQGGDAFNCFLRATELDPDYAMAWNNIGLCCHELNHYEEAEECFRSAIRLAPRLVDAYLNLVRLLRHLEREEEAREVGEQGLGLSPNDKMRKLLCLQMGEITRNLGRFVESRSFFTQLLALEPESLQYLANAELVYTSAKAESYYALGAVPAPSKGVRRVALFAPGEHYLNTLWGLKRAFEQQGCQCVIGWPLLQPAALTPFINDFAPDLIVEINRTRHQAKVIPSHVKHAAWIQDGTLAFDQNIDEFGGSDRTYFMARPESFGYPAELLEQDQHFAILLPAADPFVYCPDDSSSRKYDFAFAGYIPPPQPQLLEEVTFIRDGEPRIFSADQLESLLREAGIFQWSIGDCAYPLIHKHLCEHLKISLDQLQIPDASFPKITALMRLLDRKDLLDQVLDVSDSLLLNGPDTWLKWPRFAPYYKGMLYDARELAECYRSSQVVLHNGVSALHPRTFECLSTGSVLMINRCYTDDKPGSIYNYLVPGEEYVEYYLPEARETLREVLADPQKLESIRRAGRAKVLENHTWEHRVRQILAEL